MHHHTDRITHTTAFVTLVVEHWLEREGEVWILILSSPLDLVVVFVTESESEMFPTSVQRIKNYHKCIVSHHQNIFNLL